MSAPARHYARWSPDDIARLRALFRAGHIPREIAVWMGRTEDAIRTMIYTLELRR